MTSMDRPAPTAALDASTTKPLIDEEVVAALLREQHPSLAALPLRPAICGFDNAMFRLGESFAMRLPRSALAAELIENEQRWLMQLSDRLPLPVPVPLRVGRPGCGFPWRWSVVPWLVGSTADVTPANAAEAPRLAKFLTALHVPAPEGAPRNPHRALPLASRAAAIEQRISRLAQATDLITPRIRAAWQQACEAPIDVEPTWIHGDLHARNVLALEGRITGVLDWGDMTCGDCAVDLASFWMLLPDGDARAAAMRSYRTTSDATWLRARGWAVLFGIMLLDSGLAGHPGNAALGERILQGI